MVPLVGLHHDPLAPPPLDELERAGADRLAVELRGVQVGALEQVLGDDPGPRIDEHGQERAGGIAQAEAHGVIVHHLDRADAQLVGLLGVLLGRQLGEAGQRVEVRAVRRRDARIEHRVEREGDVAGSEGLAVVPRHALPELERVGQPVPGDVPRLGQQRPHGEVLVELQQAVEQRPLHRVRHAVGGDDGIERGRVAAEPDDEIAAGRAARRGRAERQRDGEHDEEDRVDHGPSFRRRRAAPDRRRRAGRRRTG